MIFELEEDLVTKRPLGDLLNEAYRYDDDQIECCLLLLNLIKKSLLDNGNRLGELASRDSFGTLSSLMLSSNPEVVNISVQVLCRIISAEGVYPLDSDKVKSLIFTMYIPDRRVHIRVMMSFCQLINTLVKHYHENVLCGSNWLHISRLLTALSESISHVLRHSLYAILRDLTISHQGCEKIYNLSFFNQIIIDFKEGKFSYQQIIIELIRNMMRASRNYQEFFHANHFSSQMLTLISSKNDKVCLMTLECLRMLLVSRIMTCTEFFDLGLLGCLLFYLSSFDTGERNAINMECLNLLGYFIGHVDNDQLEYLVRNGVLGGLLDLLSYEVNVALLMGSLVAIRDLLCRIKDTQMTEIMDKLILSAFTTDVSRLRQLRKISKSELYPDDVRLAAEEVMEFISEYPLV